MEGRLARLAGGDFRLRAKRYGETSTKLKERSAGASLALGKRFHEHQPVARADLAGAPPALV
jgi:hypothetical protein